MSQPRILDLPADPLARGHAHGESYRALIHEHVDAWLRSVDGGKARDPSSYVDEFLDQTDFLPAIRTATPDLLTEIEGIAEGAGLPFRTLFALQLLDEEWAFSARRTASAADRDKCSSFAVRGDGTTLIGQTMDLGSYSDGFQVVLRWPEDGASCATQVFSLAGLVALMGVNADGLGVCVNSLPQLANAPTGLPVAFAVRAALDCRDAVRAAKRIAGVSHATGQHYLLADHRDIFSLEGSSAGCAPYRAPDPRRVFHTNHPLAPVSPDASTLFENSHTRLVALQKRLGGGDSSLVAALDALRSRDDANHPVCRLHSAGHGNINYTTGSIVSEISASPVVSHISFGPPSENPFVTLPLRR